MRSSPSIGKFFRTRLRVHYSWILALIIIIWVVTTQFSTDYPFWMRLASGAIAGVSFFLAITFRELVLIIMAIYKAVEVESVTLFAFGGLIEVDHRINRELARGPYTRCQPCRATSIPWHIQGTSDKSEGGHCALRKRLLRVPKLSNQRMPRVSIDNPLHGTAIILIRV